MSSMNKSRTSLLFTLFCVALGAKLIMKNILNSSLKINNGQIDEFKISSSPLQILSIPETFTDTLLTLHSH